MLYARFSMRPSQSKLQYSWNPSILLSTLEICVNVVNWIHILLINRTYF